MKYALLVLLFIASLPLTVVRSEDSHGDPLAGAFFPPDLIFRTREKIGVSQEQIEAIRIQVEKSQSRMDDIRKRLERENAALSAVAKQQPVNEAAIIAQLDKLLDAERDMKHLHIGLLASVKNLLTPDQQTKLREIMKDGGAKLADEIRKRLTDKVAQVQAGAEKLQGNGRDPAAIAQAMEQKFKPLIEAGKVIEAEAELDRVLELLKKELE